MLAHTIYKFVIAARRDFGASGTSGASTLRSALRLSASLRARPPPLCRPPGPVGGGAL